MNGTGNASICLDEIGYLTPRILFGHEYHIRDELWVRFTAPNDLVQLTYLAVLLCFVLQPVLSSG